MFIAFIEIPQVHIFLVLGDVVTVRTKRHEIAAYVRNHPGAVGAHGLATALSARCPNMRHFEHRVTAEVQGRTWQDSVGPGGGPR